MEPGDAASSRQDEEKLARLAAIAEAVSHRKRASSSAMAEHTPMGDIPKQQSRNTTISDALRRKGRGATSLSETHPSIVSGSISTHPGSRYEIPSTVEIAGNRSSSVSRKRPRVAYPSTGYEQQISPIGMGGETQIHQYHQQQQLTQNHQEESPQGVPSRTSSGSQSQPSVEGVRFREYQAEIWSEKFEELCMFRRFHGHCHVPHHYNQNTGLAQWVKRQRYQYKLKLDGKRSTLSDERVRLLNKIGFIWNSHDAVWEERLQDLMAYKRAHGHCIVPSNFEGNPQLAVWTKRQRRQYKKYTDGTSSSMTPDRIAKLENIGFVWDCRKINKADDIRGDLTGVSGSAAASAASIVAPVGVHWQKRLGSTSGIGAFSSQGSIGNINPGMSTSTIHRGTERTSPMPFSTMSNWGNPAFTSTIDGGSFEHQQSSSQSSSGVTTYPYTGSTGTASSSTGLAMASNFPIGAQTYPGPVAMFPTIRTEHGSVSTTMKSGGDNSSEMSQRREQHQMIPKQKPRCDFFSFSRKFHPHEKKDQP